MNSWTWETILIITLQAAGDWIRPVMDLFTWLGYPQAYMVLIALLYWNFDRKLGIRLAIFLPLCASMNSILKQAIHAPRPYWVSGDILAMHPDNGFGMPSGHAQSATVWLLAGAYVRNGWFWIPAIFITGMVGMSRAYLGVHFPTQIIVGWLIGIMIIVLYTRFEQPFAKWFHRKILSFQMGFLVAITAVLTGAGLLFLGLMDHWIMPVEWIKNASETLIIDHSILKSYGLASVSGNAGSFLGVTMGAVLSARKGVFNTRAAWWKKISRSVIGLAFLAVIFTGMRFLESRVDNPVQIALLRFGVFYISTMLLVWVLPALFRAMGLLQFTKHTEGEPLRS